jgi:hypothetical protein
LKSFWLVILQHIPREHNEEANRLAQSASGYRENQEAFAMEVCAFGSDLAEDNWRKEIVDYLENPSRKVSRKLRYKACSFGWTFILQIIRWGVAIMPGSRRSKENDERGA